MNTLGKSFTCKFFKSPEEYGRMKRAWSWAMQSRTKLSAPHHWLYLVLCGKNWTKAFTQAKRFAHPSELAIVRARYPLNALPKRHSTATSPPHFHQRRSPYDYFDEYLSDDAEQYINALLPKVSEIECAIREGKPLEPYVLPVEAPNNG